MRMPVIHQIIESLTPCAFVALAVLFLDSSSLGFGVLALFPLAFLSPRLLAISVSYQRLDESIQPLLEFLLGGVAH